MHLLHLSSDETHSGGSLGAGVRRARDTEGLLRFRLVRSLLALDALVESAVQVCSRLAYRQRALLDGGGSNVRGGSTEGTGLAGGLYTLSAISATGARFAFSFDGQLLAGAALVTALLAGHRLGCPRGLAEAAQQAGEATLVRLVESVTAAATQTGHVVVVLAGRATFLAVGRAACPGTYGHAGTTSDHRTGTASQLTGFALVGTHRARRALLRLLVVISAHRARHCKHKRQRIVQS